MTLANIDANKTVLMQIKDNMEKCYHFDKGYCKLKSKCLKNHPSSDCKGQCQDKKSCSSRHRVECKNGNECIYKASKICEFLYVEKHTYDYDNNLLKSIHESIENIKDRMKGIEEQIGIFTTTITQTQTRISMM